MKTTPSRLMFAGCVLAAIGSYMPRGVGNSFTIRRSINRNHRTGHITSSFSQRRNVMPFWREQKNSEGMAGLI
jgi:hypothetical protein